MFSKLKNNNLTKHSNALLHFRAFGFMVLRNFFDPAGLIREVNCVLEEGTLSSLGPVDGPVNKFQYVPMMTGETPNSLMLLDCCESVAETILGKPVTPTRAKAVRYSGDTSWHADSLMPIASLGFLAYLEQLDADNGALRVIPGSHHSDFCKSIQTLGTDVDAKELPGYPVTTEPGDLIVLDEHIFHASWRGSVRRQWRVDFIQHPTTVREQNFVRSYFEAIYAADRDACYDIDRFPSYGEDWKKSRRPAAERLQKLGVYELAGKQENFMRSLRAAKRGGKTEE